MVTLAQATDRAQEVHRRLLGFSISHELEGVRIYGYYPEIDDDSVRYYRWEVKQFNIWTQEDKWTCYHFVKNLDREFLPLHVDRLRHFLEEIPDPSDMSFDSNANYDVGSQASRGPGYCRPSSSQNQKLQPELRSMIQSLQQQLDERQAREDRQAAEQKAREEKLLAQLEQQRAELEQHRAEQKVREEKLLAQLEQQRSEQKGLEERLFKLLERIA